MTLTTEAEHLAVFRPDYVVVTSSTDARGIIFTRSQLEAATSATKVDVPTPSSTKPIVSSQSIERELQQLFEAFRHEVFEDGIESEFSKQLVQIISTKGNLALLELNALLRAPNTSANVAAEALRWLGQIRDSETHAYRRWILADLLKAPNVLVRDGAIVGLLNLNDSSVKHAVETARDSETSAQLREDLSQLLEELEMPERHYALFAEENTQGTVES
jgi:hypothetical protein